MNSSKFLSIEKVDYVCIPFYTWTCKLRIANHIKTGEVKLWVRRLAKNPSQGSLLGPPSYILTYSVVTRATIIGIFDDMWYG